MDDIKANTGLPFKNKAAATTAIRKHGLEGYEAFEVEPGVWVGRKAHEVYAQSVIEQNQAAMEELLSDAEVADLEPDETKEPEPDYSGLDVICPGCGGRFYKTTEAFNPDRNANLACIDLLPKYRGWGWEELPKDPHSGYGCLVCPDCGTALAPSGKLRAR